MAEPHVLATPETNHSGVGRAFSAESVSKGLRSRIFVSTDLRLRRKRRGRTFVSTDLRLRWNGGRSRRGSGYVDRGITCLTSLDYSGARRPNTPDRECELPAGTKDGLVLEGNYLVTIYVCKDPGGSVFGGHWGLSRSACHINMVDRRRDGVRRNQAKFIYLLLFHSPSHSWPLQFFSGSL